MTKSRTDLELKERVMDELRWDSRVDETATGVSVRDGIVMLTGTVSGYAQKLAAQEAAHRVNGVQDVVNDIKVMVPGSLARTDADIAQAVRNALEWDVLVPDKQIQSTVSDGWVTLEGKVDYLSEVEDAERAVRQLSGVRGVYNKITVTTPEAASAGIVAVIEDALERRAEREADRIKVGVDAGVVTLSGRVHSWEEKRAVLGAVSHARGVRSVHDRLVIDPYF